MQGKKKFMGYVDRHISAIDVITNMLQEINKKIIDELKIDSKWMDSIT